MKNFPLQYREMKQVHRQYKWSVGLIKSSCEISPRCLEGKESKRRHFASVPCQVKKKHVKVLPPCKIFKLQSMGVSIWLPVGVPVVCAATEIVLVGGKKWNQFEIWSTGARCRRRRWWPEVAGRIWPMVALICRRLHRRHRWNSSGKVAPNSNGSELRPYTTARKRSSKRSSSHRPTVGLGGPLRMFANLYFLNWNTSRKYF